MQWRWDLRLPWAHGPVTLQHFLAWATWCPWQVWSWAFDMFLRSSAQETRGFGHDTPAPKSVKLPMCQIVIRAYPPTVTPFLGNKALNILSKKKSAQEYCLGSPCSLGKQEEIQTNIIVLKTIAWSHVVSASQASLGRGGGGSLHATTTK